MSSRGSKIDSKENSDEDEEEHTRLMKEQEKYNQESILEEQDIDDEYERIIEASEKLDRGDAKMDDLDPQDYVEEDKYSDHIANADRGNPRSDYANDKSHEVNDGSPLIKRGLSFESFANPSKNLFNNVSNFARRGVSTKETSALGGYLTPQKNFYQFPLSNPRLDTRQEVLASSRQDLDEKFRREILQTVKVKVEELQSNMKVRATCTTF